VCVMKSPRSIGFIIINLCAALAESTFRKKKENNFQCLLSDNALPYGFSLFSDNIKSSQLEG